MCAMGLLAAARSDFADRKGFLLQRIGSAAEGVVRMQSQVAVAALCVCGIGLLVRQWHPIRRRRTDTAATPARMQTHSRMRSRAMPRVGCSGLGRGKCAAGARARSSASS